LKLAERSAELEAPEKVTKELRAKAAADACVETSHWFGWS
jgi:hypothetical protein